MTTSESSSGVLTVPTVDMVGGIARVRLEERETIYVAEVVQRFGRIAWAGSWHGFTLENERPVQVVEWVVEP